MCLQGWEPGTNFFVDKKLRLTEVSHFTEIDMPGFKMQVMEENSLAYEEVLQEGSTGEESHYLWIQGGAIHTTDILDLLNYLYKVSTYV